MLCRFRAAGTVWGWGRWSRSVSEARWAPQASSALPACAAAWIFLKHLASQHPVTYWGYLWRCKMQFLCVLCECDIAHRVFKDFFLASANSPCQLPAVVLSTRLNKPVWCCHLSGVQPENILKSYIYVSWQQETIRENKKIWVHKPFLMKWKEKYEKEKKYLVQIWTIHRGKICPIHTFQLFLGRTFSFWNPSKSSEKRKMSLKVLFQGSIPVCLGDFRLLEITANSMQIISAGSRIKVMDGL